MYFGPERHITHFNIDSLFVNVEVLKNTRLKNKPLVIGAPGDRSIVIACNHEAASVGIQRAMPLRKAKQLCPSAVFVNGDLDEYSKYSALVTEIINDTAPVFEKAAMDQFYIDLTGMDKFFGCFEFSTRLARRVLRESGLGGYWALAGNKLVSRIGAMDARPDQRLRVPVGTERQFLAGKPVTRLPGIGAETAYQLHRMGVVTIQTLRQIPLELLHTLLGKDSITIARKANGIDEEPVIPYKDQKTLADTITFQADSIDLNFLHASITRLTEKLAFTLRKQNKLTGCITVTLRYSTLETFTKQAVIPFTNSDQELITRAREIFTRLFERRILVRMIGIKFTRLVQGSYQISLFGDTQETLQLFKSVDQVKKRFGESYVMRASAQIRK